MNFDVENEKLENRGYVTIIGRYGRLSMNRSMI